MESWQQQEIRTISPRHDPTKRRDIALDFSLLHAEMDT
jgi:hypothetical protein